MLSTCYLMLGLCSYHQNNLEKALEYTENGINTFHPDGERPYTIYTLLRNKAIYLERMGRVVEGLKVVEQVWEDLAENPADGNLFEPVLVEGGIAPPQRRPGRRDGSVHGRVTYRPHQQGIRQFVRFVDGFGEHLHGERRMGKSRSLFPADHGNPKR